MGRNICLVYKLLIFFANKIARTDSTDLKHSPFPLRTGKWFCFGTPTRICREANLPQSHPLPAVGDGKGLFLLGDGGEGLLFFDLAFLDQLLFFGADALQQDVGGLVVGILGHKSALDGVLEEGVFQLLGVPGLSFEESGR